MARSICAYRPWLSTGSRDWFEPQARSTRNGLSGYLHRSSRRRHRWPGRRTRGAAVGALARFRRRAALERLEEATLTLVPLAVGGRRRARRTKQRRVEGLAIRGEPSRSTASVNRRLMSRQVGRCRACDRRSEDRCPCRRGSGLRGSSRGRRAVDSASRASRGQRRNLARQPQHDPRRAAGAMRGRDLEDRFEILVGKTESPARPSRRRGSRHRQRLHHSTERRCRCARIELARERLVEYRDRDIDASKILAAIGPRRSMSRSTTRPWS